MIRTYFNCEMVGSHVPSAERLKGICFRPLHYFCDGKTYTWERDEVSSRERSYKGYYGEASPLQMAVLIVPGMIVGTIAAVVALAQWYFQGKLPALRILLKEEVMIHNFINQDFKKRDQETPHDIPKYTLPDNFSINVFHQGIQTEWSAFLKSHFSKTSHNITKTKPGYREPAWAKEDTIQAFDSLIKKAHQKTHLIFQQVAKEAKGNPQTMAKLLANQHVWSDGQGENYCLSFFYAGMVEMYKHVREPNLISIINDYQYYQPLSRNYYSDFIPDKLFFIPGTMQYNWRRLYNDVCALIDQYPGLRGALEKEENRYLTNLCADYHPGDFRTDTIPTL